MPELIIPISLNWLKYKGKVNSIAAYLLSALPDQQGEPIYITKMYFEKISVKVSSEYGVYCACAKPLTFSPLVALVKQLRSKTGSICCSSVVLSTLSLSSRSLSKHYQVSLSGGMPVCVFCTPKTKKN